MRLRKLQSASRQICDAFGIAKKHYPEIVINDDMKELGTFEVITADSVGLQIGRIEVNRKLCRNDNMPLIRVLIHEICHHWISLHEINLNIGEEDVICDLIESLLAEYTYNL